MLQGSRFQTNIKRMWNENPMRTGSPEPRVPEVSCDSSWLNGTGLGQAWSHSVQSSFKKDSLLILQRSQKPGVSPKQVHTGLGQEVIDSESMRFLVEGSHLSRDPFQEPQGDA